MTQSPSTNDLIPQLAKAVNQLDGWDRSNMPGREKMMLHWAQWSHYLATMILAATQDEANGNSEGPPHTED